MDKPILQELFRSFEEKDFGKTIDLHMHSTFSDGELTPDELLADAKKKNLKYIAIADHNTVDGYKNSHVLDDEIVIPAIEFDCWFQGVLVHILGYGIDIHNENLLKYCAKNKRETQVDIVRLFNNRSPKDVIKAIHSAGGIAVLAHPACYWCISLDWFVKDLIKYGLDGIEAYYPYKRHRAIIKFHLAASVKKIAQKYNLVATGGSDSHGKIELFIF